MNPEAVLEAVEIQMFRSPLRISHQLYKSQADILVTKVLRARNSSNHVKKSILSSPSTEFLAITLS